MQINTDIIDTYMKKKQLADILANAEAKYKKIISNSRVDKDDFSFGVTKHHSFFCSTVSFNAYYGEYGSSNCSNMLHMPSLDDVNALVSRFLVEYLNKHKSEVLQYLAKRVNENADELRNEIRGELEKINEMLDSSDKGEQS